MPEVNPEHRTRSKLWAPLGVVQNQKQANKIIVDHNEAVLNIFVRIKYNL